MLKKVGSVGSVPVLLDELLAAAIYDYLKKLNRLLSYSPRPPPPPAVQGSCSVTVSTRTVVGSRCTVREEYACSGPFFTISMNVA